MSEQNHTIQYHIQHKFYSMFSMNTGHQIPYLRSNLSYKTSDPNSMSGEILSSSQLIHFPTVTQHEGSSQLLLLIIFSTALYRKVAPELCQGNRCCSIVVVRSAAVIDSHTVRGSTLIVWSLWLMGTNIPMRLLMWAQSPLIHIPPSHNNKAKLPLPWSF